MIEIEKNTFHIKCHSSSSTSYVRRISSGNHQAIFYKSLRNFTNITEKTYRAEDFSHRPPPNTFKHRDHKLDFRTIWEKDLFKHALVYVWKSKLAILQNYYRNTINAKPSWDLAWFWKKKQDQYQSSQKRIQTKIWCSRWIRIKPIKSVLVKKPDTNKKLKTKKKTNKKILKPMRMKMLCTIWKTVCQTSQTKIFKTWRFWNSLIKWPGDHSLN